jgi:hypothetical protein
MKIAIVGSRAFSDYELMEKWIPALIPQKEAITEIVSGGARGADSLAERYARKHEIPLKVFPANWNLYGKSAGFMRNAEIVAYCDRVIAFWDGFSHGTQDTMNKARIAGKPVACVEYNTGGRDAR